MDISGLQYLVCPADMSTALLQSATNMDPGPLILSTTPHSCKVFSELKYA
jgi:hypothetical protein